MNKEPPSEDKEETRGRPKVVNKRKTQVKASCTLAEKEAVAEWTKHLGLKNDTKLVRAKVIEPALQFMQRRAAGLEVAPAVTVVPPPAALATGLPEED